MRRAGLILIPMIAVVLFACVSPSGATLGSSKFNNVTMIYVGGESCVVVDKDPAVIFHQKKPKRVKWVVTVPGKYWEVRYQPTPGSSQTKKPGTGNYFANSGNLDIGCTGSSVETALPSLSPSKASWPYMIRVYECNGQSKGALLCELDPMIDWGD